MALLRRFPERSYFGLWVRLGRGLHGFGNCWRSARPIRGQGPGPWAHGPVGLRPMGPGPVGLVPMGGQTSSRNTILRIMITRKWPIAKNTGAKTEIEKLARASSCVLWLRAALKKYSDQNPNRKIGESLVWCIITSIISETRREFHQ